MTANIDITRIHGSAPGIMSDLADTLQTPAHHATREQLLDLAAVLMRGKVVLDCPEHVAAVCRLLVEVVEPDLRDATEERDEARLQLEELRRIHEQTQATERITHRAAVEACRQLQVARSLAEAYQGRARGLEADLRRMRDELEAALQAHEQTMERVLALETAPTQRALESACRAVTGRGYEEVNAELDTVVVDPEES